MFIKKAPKRVGVKGYKTKGCTCNALGNALGLSYDLSMKILQSGDYSNNRFTFKRSQPRTRAQMIKTSNVKNICESLSVDIEDHYINSDGTPDIPMKLSEFAQAHPKGIYLVLMVDHIATVMYGKIIDTWDSSSHIVRTSYKVDTRLSRSVIRDLAKFYKLNNDEHIIKGHVDKILHNK